MRRSFSIQARGEIFYVQFWNPETRKYSSAISTGAKDRDSAIAIVADWMRNGIPFERAEPPWLGGRAGFPTKTTVQLPIEELFNAECMIKLAIGCLI